MQPRQNECVTFKLYFFYNSLCQWITCITSTKSASFNSEINPLSFFSGWLFNFHLMSILNTCSHYSLWQNQWRRRQKWVCNMQLCSRKRKSSTSWFDCEAHYYFVPQVMVTNVTSLLKTVKAVEDEATRGTRALEATIECIKQELTVRGPDRPTHFFCGQLGDEPLPLSEPAPRGSGRSVSISLRFSVLFFPLLSVQLLSSSFLSAPAGFSQLSLGSWW